MAQTFDLSVLFKMVDRFSSPLKQAMHSFNKFSEQAKKANSVTRQFGMNVSDMGRKVRGFGAMLSVGVTLPLTLLVKSAIGVARDFDRSMNMVGAVTRTKIGDEIKPAFIELRKEAKRLGASTIFTTQQVADGMQVMGLKGLSVNQIFEVMPKVLELATAAQMDIAESANIVINIMNSQKLSVEELSTVNDVLVSAFTRSSAQLGALGESFKYAGNITRVTGLSIQETAASFAFMAKVGIDASMAGTAMRTAMAKLAAPSKQMIGIMHRLGVKIYQMKDGKRVVKPFIDILKEFERAGADAVSMTELLGLRAGPGFASLLGMSEEIEELIRLMGVDVGIASQIAITQMSGLPKVIAELVAAWEIVRISFMESKFGDWVQSFIKWFTNLLRTIADADPTMKAIAAAVLVFIGVLAPVISLLGLFVMAIGAIVANAAIIGTVVAIGAAFATMAAAVTLLITNLDAIAAWFNSIPEKINGFANAVERMAVSIFDSLTSMIPDFVLKWMGSGEGQSLIDQARVNQLATVTSNNKSSADITIKVTSENGSSATIGGVTKKGDAKVNVINDAYLGMGAAFGGSGF